MRVAVHVAVTEDHLAVAHANLVAHLQCMKHSRIRVRGAYDMKPECEIYVDSFLHLFARGNLFAPINIW